MIGVVIMSDNEIKKVAIEEFSRLQDYMLASEKDSAAYKIMKKRYVELKVIINSMGVNLTEIDFVNE